MTGYEFAVAVVAVMINAFLYNKTIKNNDINFKETVIIILGSLPVVLLSINMVSDTITKDEWYYMSVITKMKDIIATPDVAAKLMLQYRTSQMIFGTFFCMIPSFLHNALSMTDLIIAYKVLHWIVFYCIGLFIVATICKKYIIQAKEPWKNILSWLTCFYIITGLPMSISLMKVCNYDASNVLFGALGIILVGVNVIDTLKANGAGSIKYGRLGIFISILGCLDKWSSGIYFIMCAILYCFAKIVRCKDGFIAKFKQVNIGAAYILFFSLIFGFINLEYIRIVLTGGELYEKIRFGHVAFSFTELFLIVFEETAARVSEYALVYVFLLYIVIVVAAIMMYGVYILIKNSKILSYTLDKISLSCFVVMVVLGIYGAFFVPQMMAPYEAVKPGEYSSVVLWGEYHYGAYSLMGHKLLQCIYAFATVICNLPTSILILFVVYIFTSFKNKKRNQVYQYVTTASIAVIVILACMDQPSDPRYFGVSILLMCLSVFVTLYNSFIVTCAEWKIKRGIIIGMMGAFICWVAELTLYEPNIKIFSPLWCCRSTEWKRTVRLGHWEAGEAMSWGEELALAGKKINKIVEKKGLAFESVTIYSSYGQIWLKNPGYVLKSTDEINKDTEFDDTTYFIWTKKSLFRTMELPPFLEEIEPVDTVEYNGEICSWIYSGVQLKEYVPYFEY